MQHLHTTVEQSKVFQKLLLFSIHCLRKDYCELNFFANLNQYSPLEEIWTRLSLISLSYLGTIH